MRRPPIEQALPRLQHVSPWVALRATSAAHHGLDPSHRAARRHRAWRCSRRPRFRDRRPWSTVPSLAGTRDSMRRLTLRMYRAIPARSRPRRPAAISSSTRAGGFLPTNLLSAGRIRRPTAVIPFVGKSTRVSRLKLFFLHHDDVGTGILGPSAPSTIRPRRIHISRLYVKTAPRRVRRLSGPEDLGGADRRSVGGDAAAGTIL